MGEVRPEVHLLPAIRTLITLIARQFRIADSMRVGFLDLLDGLFETFLMDTLR